MKAHEVRIGTVREKDVAKRELTHLTADQEKMAKCIASKTAAHIADANKKEIKAHWAAVTKCAEESVVLIF